MFIYLAVLGLPCGMWDLWLWYVNSELQYVASSSLTRDQTRGPCFGSTESQFSHWTTREVPP